MDLLFSDLGRIVGCVLFVFISIVVIIIISALITRRKFRHAVKIADYQQAKKRMINTLKESIEAQIAGRLNDIGAGYDDLDFSLPRDNGPEFQKLLDALHFWDNWIDARNHHWKIHKNLQAEDWPRLAALIIADLEADREIKSHLENILI